MTPDWNFFVAPDEPQAAEPRVSDSATDSQAANPADAARERARLQFDLEEQELEDRIEHWRCVLSADGPAQAWLVRDIALATLRIDKCCNDADAWRLRQASRSPLAWQIDRQVAAAELAQGLPRRPEVVAAKLKQSLHGCEVLIQRFASLVARVRADGPKGPPRALDQTGRKLALDALGVPLAEREGLTRLDPPLAENGDVAAHQLALFDDQIAQLQRLRLEVLVARDEADRAASEAGEIPAALDPTLRAIRRDEAVSRRNMNWALALFETAKKADKRQKRQSEPAPSSSMSERMRERIDWYTSDEWIESPPMTHHDARIAEWAASHKPAPAAEAPHPVAPVPPAASPSVPLARSAEFGVSQPTSHISPRISLADALAPPPPHAPIVNPLRDKKKRR